jgi:hypothetical protein
MPPSTAMASRRDPVQDLVDMLLGNRQYLVRTIIDNNHLAVVRNMQEYLQTNEVFTPNGLEKIVMAAKSPETMSAMNEVLDVPWQPTQDANLNEAYHRIQQRAEASGGPSLRVFPVAGVAAALGSLIGLVTGGKKDAQRAAQEAAAAQARAAEQRKQFLIIAGIAVGTLVVVVILYKLATR